MKLTECQITLFTEMAEQDYKLYMDFHNRPKDMESWEIFCVWSKYEAMFSMYISKFIGYRYYSSAPELSGVYTKIKPTEESVKHWFENLPDKAPDTQTEKKAESSYKSIFDFDY